jgi:hypothetical protein
VKEYVVSTTCGRLFAWSAVDLEDLHRSLSHRGYFAKRVQLMTEYQKEMGK